MYKKINNSNSQGSWLQATETKSGYLKQKGVLLEGY